MSNPDTVNSSRPSAAAAVTSWWQAMQAGDLASIAAATLPDHISTGGPEGRTVGREPLLVMAEAFLAEASIQHWSVTALEVREHGDVAVCSYEWAEQGVVNGARFELRGVATDVLVFRDGRWHYQAHHVGLLDRPIDAGQPA
ncbi:nuclear transport factor 2 family protein [Micromonospora sp. NPDC050686]|uniref:YybH family protein n=1 Tax=Micromonospora sp. NPDC050686 TaxID=3154631 RepID=UPI0033D494D5